MSSVFFDTNVWLPAVISDGFSRRVVREAEKQGTVFISAELVDEVVEKLALKFRTSWDTIEQAKTLMTTSGRMFVETVEPYAASPDPDDAVLLAQARRAGCEKYVTLDSALLALRTIGGMEIVSLRRFAQSLGLI